MELDSLGLHKLERVVAQYDRMERTFDICLKKTAMFVVCQFSF